LNEEIAANDPDYLFRKWRLINRNLNGVKITVLEIKNHLTK